GDACTAGADDVGAGRGVIRDADQLGLGRADIPLLERAAFDRAEVLAVGRGGNGRDRVHVAAKRVDQLAAGDVERADQVVEGEIELLPVARKAVRSEP